MSWWLPALKAVLPHVGTIIDAAKPVFTRKSVATAANPSELLQQQISELQAAAAQNATNIRELASQLQSTVAAIEQAAAATEANLRRSLAFSIAALVVATLSLCVAAVLVVLLLRA
ncbi:MAG TPA: hypothetical protein VEB41_06690 [Burkholderiales bacterium]|nr:hypothetical protein [Burkholderiales bacterium]